MSSQGRSLPAIKTSIPMPKMEEDVPTPTVADSQSKSDSVGQNSTGWEEPQPERGSESVSTQREELQISSKPLTNSLLGSSAPAFSSNSGSSNGPPAAQTQVKETQGEGPVPIAHQQPVTHQTHAYSAPPTAYPMNPYYGPAPSQPWGYPIPPPHPHPQPHDHVPPNTPSSLPSSAGYPDPYAAFSQAAAASLYNPALYGMHPWSYADLVSSGFNYSAGLLRPGYPPMANPNGLPPSSNPARARQSASANMLHDLTSDSELSASDATSSSRKSHHHHHSHSSSAQRKVRSSSSSSLLNPAAQQLSANATNSSTSLKSTSSQPAAVLHPPPPPPPPSLKSASLTASISSSSSGNKSEKKYFCPHCSDAFARNFNLKSHISCKHMGEKPFACNCCAKTFSRKHDTARHLAARHGYSHAEATAEVNKRYPVGGSGNGHSSGTGNTNSLSSSSVHDSS